MSTLTLDGKPYAGNPHMRFNEENVASAKPRCASLLCGRLGLIAAALVVLTVGAFSASAAESYEQVMPVAARHYNSKGEASGNYSADRGEIYAINGAGMNADGLTHQSDAANKKMWMCQDLTAAFMITMATNETGEAVARDFSRIKIFNCNWSGYTNRGIKKFSVWGGDAWPDNGKPSAAWIQANFTKIDVGMEELPQAPGKTTYAGETFDLPSTLSAKYVAIVVGGSNWGDSVNFTSLSEVQFFNRVVEPGDPYLPKAELVETEDGLSVTGVVGNAAAKAGYCALADDGVHVYEAFADEPTAVGDGFALAVDTAGWVIQQSFLFYALAKNDAGVTSNKLGRVFVGGLPSDRNVWIAPADAADRHASVAANWSQGLPSPGGLPLMFSPVYGDSDVIWDTGVNGLPAIVPQAAFSEYEHTFTVDSATPTAFAPRGQDPFAVRHLRIGSTVPTAVTLGAGAYAMSETVAFGGGAGSSLVLSDGVAMTVGLGFTSSAGDVTIERGATLGVGKGYTVGSNTTVRGVVVLDHVDGGTSASLTTYSNGGVLVVDGGAVTNKACANYNATSGSSGSRVTVKNGGRLMHTGLYTYFHAYGGPLLVEVLSGGLLQINGSSSYIGCNNEGNNAYPCDVIVSNATWRTSCVCRIPRDPNGCHSHFTLVEDPGETASATFGEVELDALVAVNEKGFRTDNSITVNGGTFTASSMKIGSTGATKDGTNCFCIARANSRVTFSSLTMNENGELRIRLPAGGFILSGEAAGSPENPAVNVTGAASFNERSKIVVDASEITNKGIYTLLTARTLGGFSTPEDIASRIVVKNAHLKVEPIVDGKSVKLKFRTGLIIIVR